VLFALPAALSFLDEKRFSTFADTPLFGRFLAVAETEGESLATAVSASGRTRERFPVRYCVHIYRVCILQGGASAFTHSL
jgi:hypothetical protein